MKNVVGVAGLRGVAGAIIEHAVVIVRHLAVVEIRPHVDYFVFRRLVRRRIWVVHFSLSLAPDSKSVQTPPLGLDNFAVV